MPFPHVGEEAGKHLFNVDAIRKAMPFGLDSAADVVEGRMKDEIAEPPAHEIVVGNWLELVLLRRPGPERPCQPCRPLGTWELARQFPFGKHERSSVT
jgi:hypothetical protein